MSETMIVEVHGVKLEVDLRTAKRIDTLRVGSRVKVLRKEPYSSTFKVQPGVVVGFDPFPSLPTMTVAVLDVTYSEAKLEFVTFNEKTEGYEVVAALDDDALEVNKADVHSRINREIEQKTREIEDLRRRQAWFDTNFAAYFADANAMA